MMMERNYFHNVIKSENQFSQLLLNIINNNVQFRKVIEDFFFANMDIEFDILNSQKRNKYGQPDISTDLKDEGFAIIEVKTQDSELTANQPEGYVQILKDKSTDNKHLFFLIPKYYKHEQNIRDRYNAISKTSEIKFEICYWNDLIKKFIKTLSNLSNGEDNLMNEIIFHLHEKFGFNNITFEINQIEIMKTNVIPSTILKLNKVINSVAKSFSFKDIKWTNDIDYGYENGCSFIYKKQIYIGYFFDLWNDTNASLVILVNKDTVDVTFLNSFISFFSKYGVIQDYATQSKFLDISHLLSETNNVEQINEMIIEFLNQTSIQ